MSRMTDRAAPGEGMKQEGVPPTPEKVSPPPLRRPGAAFASHPSVTLLSGILSRGQESSGGPGDTPASPGASVGLDALQGPCVLCVRRPPRREQERSQEKGPGSLPPSPCLSPASQNSHLSGRLCFHAFPGHLAKKAGFVPARTAPEQ